ncbi:TPA: staphylococcal enterotoxin type Q [Staphylococcus aureus]|nr:staphylococcal enterotoxin type Q [Staphylococcus aureus]HDF1555613.1 staphylococcal enterotoxin type Q [Staphylococcus aureus]
MNKIFRVLTISLFFFTFLIKNNLAYADVGVINLRNFYANYQPEKLQGVSSGNFSTSHQLEYIDGKYTLYSQFHNEYEAKRLKDHKVDIFGISYSGLCNTKYMYGGITLANQNLDKPRNIPINLWVNGKQNTISTDKVSTQKKEVTAQEIDIKLRKYLQNEYNIYGFNKTKKGQEYGYKSKFNSGFNKGKITFHLNNEPSFTYDLFYTGTGQAESFLKIYNDNKTIDAENFHLDVEISYEKTE